MTAPKRIQLRRTKGWRKPEGAVVVSRPSRWGNPYRASEVGNPVELYRARLAIDIEIHTDDYLAELRQELGGRDLACWCPLDQPCHADVLLEIANPVEAAHVSAREQPHTT